MNITPGAYDETSRTVSVLFEHGGVAYTRTVNACYDADGQYDEQATAARVQEVARGVAVKIALGVIAPMAETDDDDTSAIWPSAPIG